MLGAGEWPHPLVLVRATPSTFLLTRRERKVFSVRAKGLAHLGPAGLGDVDPIASAISKHLLLCTKQDEQQGQVCIN